MRRLSKALPHSRSSSRTIPLGNYTHILAFGVEEGSLVRRGHIFNWRQDYKGESSAEEMGEDLSYVYLTLALSQAYYTSQCMESNWI